MNQEDIDKFVYAEAKNFLLDLCIAGVDSLLIEKYLSPTSLQPGMTPLNCTDQSSVI